MATDLDKQAFDVRALDPKTAVIDVDVHEQFQSLNDLLPYLSDHWTRYIVDYGWTQVKAYAPRYGNDPITYPDESTSYYWAVLPAQNFDGSLAVGNPLLAAAADFQKQSLAPNLVEPLLSSSAAIG